VEGKPFRMFLEGYEIGRPGGPVNITSGHDLPQSHYQIVVDASSGLRLGAQVPLGPYKELFTVVGLTSGMVTSADDPVGWVTLLDAQSLQFAVPPALERRELAASRQPATTRMSTLSSCCFSPGFRRSMSRKRSGVGSTSPPSPSSSRWIT